VSTDVPQIRTEGELEGQPEEFRDAILKIVISHAINELQGARVFDEPAIALAPTPYAKWLTCRVAMEEYGHHWRFFELGRRLGIEESRMIPEKTDKRPLSLFELPLKAWEDFVAVKLLCDLAEILQVEDLLHCPFVPLRNLARATMPEEKFHHQFGIKFGTELVRSPQGGKRLQASVNALFPAVPPFFGRARSRNNEVYRRWGIKRRSNEDMRTDYIGRARAAVEALGLTLPAAPEEIS